MHEVIEHGNRWLVADVKGISVDELIGSSKGATRAISREQEEKIISAIVAGLKDAGIEAELRSVIPPGPPGVFRLIVPMLRAYFPLKDASRDFYAALLGAAFLHATGTSSKEVMGVLGAQVIASLATRMKKLNNQELTIVKTVADLNHELDAPVPTGQLSLRLGYDVESDAVRLAERGILRNINDSWSIEF